MVKKRSNVASKPPAQTNQAVTATIDLHGYRQSEGIKTLTSFLEQVVTRQRKVGNNQDIWVLVITGSGAHSPEGPILRSAVEAVLEKRQMKFTVNRGRGSFTVKANSGIVFYEPGAPVDTKLILKDAPERIPSLPRPNHRLVQQGVVGVLLSGEDAPTPGEVATFDKVLEESRKDVQEYQKVQKKDEKLMKRAVSMSLLDAQKEDEEVQEQVQRALPMSLLDYNSSQSNLDEDLQRALELSQKEFKHGPDYSEELQRALELSQHVSSRADDELLQVLELSKKEHEIMHSSWTLGYGDESEGIEVAQHSECQDIR